MRAAQPLGTMVPIYIRIASICFLLGNFSHGTVVDLTASEGNKTIKPVFKACWVKLLTFITPG